MSDTIYIWEAGGQQWKKTNLPRKDMWLVLFFGMFFAANCLQSTKIFPD
jgi:hypothetical protein